MKLVILSAVLITLNQIPASAEHIGGIEAEKIIANGNINFVEKTENTDGLSFRTLVTYKEKVYVCLSFVKNHEQDVVVNMCIT